MISIGLRIVTLIRISAIGLVLACVGLIASPTKREISPREARQLGTDHQADARRRADRAQSEAKRRQKEVARDIKRRDRERRREAKQLTKNRRRQGKQVEAHAGQPERPMKPSERDRPKEDQPSPVERLRGYADSEPEQQTP